MRKFLKNSILEIFQTMYEAHNSIKKMIDKKDLENIQVLLEDCQNTAVQIGNSIESSEGEGFVTIGYLEEYCEAVYEVATSITDEYSGNKAKKVLDKKLIKAENSVKSDVKVRLEIVFCPYKASMWDSLESVWKAADEDPDCDAYVVPIPYYDRNPDRSFGEFHYEGGDYPDYVPITHYEAYNFEVRRPDIVYIHNPYDDCNYVTSVDPRFYSSELKKYTDKLVYIPYFVLEEPDSDDEATLKRITHFVLTPGVMNADAVILQSETMRKAYVNILLRYLKNNEENKKYDSKIFGIGSPKFDKLNDNRADLNIPTEWANRIFTNDGRRKKVVFYNTGVSMFLQYNNRMLRKIESVFLNFAEHKDDIVLLWRPHPLLKTTIESMRPWMLKDYEVILQKYQESDIGILDDSADLERAIKISDVYFGDASSVVELFCKQKKPIVFQRMFNFSYNNCSGDTISLLDRYCFNVDNENVWFIDVESHWLYKSFFSKDKRIAKPIAPIPENIHGIITGLHNNKLFIFPYADNVNFYLVYDISRNYFEKEYIDCDYHGLNYVTSSHICGNYYYTLYRDFILKIDADSGKPVKMYSTGVKLSDTYNIGYANTFISDKLYFSYYSESGLFCFDTNTTKTEKFPLNVNDIVSMCSDDNNVYMMDSLHTIYVWNRNSHELFKTVISDDDTGCYYLDEKSELVFDTQFKKNTVDNYFPSYISISNENYVFFVPYCMNNMVILRKDDFSVMTVPLADEKTDHINDSPIRYIFEYNTDEKIYLIKVGTNDHLEFDMRTFTVREVSLCVSKKDYYDSLSNIRNQKVCQSSYSILNETEILDALCNVNCDQKCNYSNTKYGFTIHQHITKKGVKNDK